MPVHADRRRSHLARDLGTMTLSCVRVDNPMALVRAAAGLNQSPAGKKPGKPV